MDLATFEDLVRLAYGSVLDPARWGAFLERLTQVSGGVRTHLFGYDIEAGVALGTTAAGYAPEYVRSYEEYYGARNAWASGFSGVAPGTVLSFDRMCPRAEVCKTEYYNDWIRPQEDIVAGGGTLLFNDGERLIAFGGNIRRRDEERLEAPWLATVGLLVPHLRHAFEIARALAGQSLELALHRDGLATGRTAVLLLSDTGRVLHANGIAEAMLHEGGVFRVDQAGRLRFAEPEAAARLSGCLESLRRHRANAAARFAVAGGMSVRAAPFDPDLHAVQPFPLLLGYARPCLLVTVRGAPESRDTLRELIRFYGLTPAEAAVVNGIADGLTLRELAGQRAVSLHTVRNQLKSAMARMSVHRQGELIRMVERLRVREP